MTTTGHGHEQPVISANDLEIADDELALQDDRDKRLQSVVINSVQKYPATCDEHHAILPFPVVK